MARTRNTSPVKVRKENLFMRVVVDEQPTFLDVTSHVGKPSPYTSKVRTTVGSRVSDDVVSFSVLQVTKASSKRILADALKIPRGTLSAIEAKAVELSKDEEFTADDIVASWEGEQYRFKYEVDDAGIVTLEPQFEDDAFEIPARALRFDFYLRSPKAERVLAVSFSGYLDRKPGEAETRTRAVMKALNNLSHLANFRILSGITATDMPPVPAGAPVAPARKADDHVIFTIPIQLWDEAASEIQGSGDIKVEIDLDHANASTGQLLYHITCEDEALDAMLPVYKPILLDTIATIMRDLLPESEQRDLTYDIVLGQVGHGEIQRLKEITSKFPGLDLTPKQYAVRN